MNTYYPVICAKKTGDRIKQIIQMRRITIKDMQKMLGLKTAQSVYHWLEGRSIPSVDNLYALSELLRVPMDSILRGNRRYRNDVLGDDICWRVYNYQRFLLDKTA